MKRIVLITGVTGGIGAATATVFCDAGWYVIGVDRRPLEMGRGIARFIERDISNPAAIASLFAEVEAKEGYLDALVNNAAIQICKPLLDTTSEEWDLVMATNVRAVALSAKYSYPLLKKRRGAIVNVGSVHAIATSQGLAAYAASKGALLSLTRAMALELGPQAIRVNAVLPGAVDTPMLHAGLTRDHVKGDTMDELVRRLGEKHVIGRVGQPEEIGKAILFLADNAQSSFITGQALVIDGGATARLSTE